MATSGRHFVFYFSWDRPQETDPHEIDPVHGLARLENRFPTMTEVRRAWWPLSDAFRQIRPGPQDIDAVLAMVLGAFLGDCTEAIRQHTGVAPWVVERQIGPTSIIHLGEQLSRANTLVIMSFDHLRTRQEPTPAEVKWVRSFLARPENCLVVCPHHSVGGSGEFADQRAEFFHHGDPLVPSQDTIGGFGRALLKSLGCPILNQFGLKPKTENCEPTPLAIDHKSDYSGILKDVPIFTAHPHLPHYEVPTELENDINVLARQEIDIESGNDPCLGYEGARDHPFLKSGRRWFDAMLQVRRFNASLLVCDVTLWLTPQSAKQKESLANFWRNVASMKL
jgi:hypothetical protein